MTALVALLMALGLWGDPVEVRSLSVSAYVNETGAPPYRGQMASGGYTRSGVCACGPGYAFGTIFLVSGKWYTCMDRGGAIDDGKLDLWMADRADALAWGRQQQRVLVIRPGGQQD